MHPSLTDGFQKTVRFPDNLTAKDRERALHVVVEELMNESHRVDDDCAIESNSASEWLDSLGISPTELIDDVHDERAVVPLVHRLSEVICKTRLSNRISVNVDSEKSSEGKLKLRKMSAFLPRLAGQQQAKETLLESIVWPRKYGLFYKSLAALPPAGILLHGPPGMASE